MKIIGFIKWWLAKVSLFTVFFFWSTSTLLCIIEPIEVAKWHMASWIVVMIVILFIAITKQIKYSYHQYLKEQRELLDMLNESSDYDPKDKWRINS